MTTTPDPTRVAFGAHDEDRCGRTAETLARIGVTLDAQMVELFSRQGGRRDADGMVLVGWWAALGHELAPPAAEALSLEWFPWSLGNIRPARHVFVRNAGSLPIRPGLEVTVADLGMGSALHVPIRHDIARVIGAVCVYWASERDEWPASECDRVAALARDELLDR
jgi:GAF domain-containing protein